MDAANCPLENSAPRLHVAPRERHQDDDAPPFFVHFERGGKAMVLTTPDTLESYFAAPQPTGDGSSIPAGPTHEDHARTLSDSVRFAFAENG